MICLRCGFCCFVPWVAIVKDPEKVIAESARVLRPGGNIIIGIIDKESFLGRFYQKKGSIFYGHARFFDIEEVVRMLKAAGFRKFSYYQTVFDYPDRLNAVEKPRKGRGKGGFVVISGEKK